MAGVEAEGQVDALVFVTLFRGVMLLGVFAPWAALAVGQAREARHLGQLEDGRLAGQGVEGRGEEGLQAFADPDHHRRLLQGGGVGGLQAGGVRRGAARDAEMRAARAQIGSASGRERVCQYVYISVVAVSLTKKHKHSNIMINLK